VRVVFRSDGASAPPFQEHSRRNKTKQYHVTKSSHSFTFPAVQVPADQESVSWLHQGSLACKTPPPTHVSYWGFYLSGQFWQSRENALCSSEVFTTLIVPLARGGLHAIKLDGFPQEELVRRLPSTPLAGWHVDRLVAVSMAVRISKSGFGRG
jgi:hypothetical protein